MSVENIKEQVDLARMQLTAGSERQEIAERHRQDLVTASSRIGELLLEITVLINGPCSAAIDGMTQSVSEAEGTYSLSVSTIGHLSEGTNNIALQNGLERAVAARNQSGSGFELLDGPRCTTSAAAIADSMSSATQGFIDAAAHLQTVKEASALLGNGIETSRTDAAEAILSLDAYVRYIAGPDTSE